MNTPATGKNTARSAEARPLRVGVFGAPLDTGNLGVSALGVSTVRGILSADPAAQVVLFDHGRRARTLELRAHDWRAEIQLVPSAYSRRFYRSSNQQQAWAAARLGLERVHPFLRGLAGFDAVLDISGGDSFADIYGEWRFQAVTLSKRLALRASRGLVLLPQTYGPFREPAHRSVATDILTGADQVWARDGRSLEVVRELLGSGFDTTRHQVGVDVAFGLPTRAPEDSETRQRVEAAGSDGQALFGLNVSGLLYLDEARSRNAFGLRVTYRDVVFEIARELLSREECNLLLVPHVTPPCGSHEDDFEACRDLCARLPEDLRRRVVLAPAARDPMEAKWTIGRCDWFCGTRMHSCIAGLSQAIPTATIAYSDKTLGVFETIGSGDWVFDPRALEARDIIAGVLATVPQREARAQRLRGAKEQIDQIWGEQFRQIVECIPRESAL